MSSRTRATPWAFIQAIAPSAQRILLGDPNQCIYAGMKKIDPERIVQATALAGAVKIVLPAVSHRDPSGVLPAAALAALERRFDDSSIAHAVTAGKLVLHRASDTRLGNAAAEIVAADRTAGRTVSVFTHTHAATAELSTALSEGGVDHEQVGFAEAFGDGLQAQFAMLRWALEKQPGVRAALAAYVRSIGRAGAEKRAADVFLDKSNPSLEKELGAVALELQQAGDSANMDQVLKILAGTHQRLGLPRGADTWLQANRQLGRAARVLSKGRSLEDLTHEIQDLRARTLIGSRAGRPKPIQVMNLHQTKGREADTTVLLLQPDEFHGKEGEPYPTGSRLLYVCLTRARQRAHIIVPADLDGVHGLWLPFVNACIAARQVSTCPNESCWGEIRWHPGTAAGHEYEWGSCDSCGTLGGRCPECDEITALDGGDWDCPGCGAVWSILRHPKHGDWIDWTPPVGSKPDPRGPGSLAASARPPRVAHGALRLPGPPPAPSSCPPRSDSGWARPRSSDANRAHNLPTNDQEARPGSGLLPARIWWS